MSVYLVSISFFGVKILEKTSFELCKKVFDDSLLKKVFLSGESRNVYIQRSIYIEAMFLLNIF